MTLVADYGALPLTDGRHSRQLGSDRLEVAVVGHRILADGGVKLTLPASGILTDAEARQLAWALLADLAPDEVVPVASVVTYREAQRLAVLRVMTGTARTSRQIAEALAWSDRTTQRRLDELATDGRVTRKREGGPAWLYSLKMGD